MGPDSHLISQLLLQLRSHPRSQVISQLRSHRILFSRGIGTRKNCIKFFSYYTYLNSLSFFPFIDSGILPILTGDFAYTFGSYIDRHIT